MRTHRFSPITTKEELLEALQYIHITAHTMCKQNLKRLLPVAGNIGVFCHFEDEFDYLTKVRKELTDINHHWNNKYYLLHKPIVIPAKKDFPETTYSYLYIRKPDLDTPNVGDVDFYLDPDEYKKLKQNVINGKYNRGFRLFERPDLDMVRLYDPQIDVSAFVHSYDLKKVST